MFPDWFRHEEQVIKNDIGKANRWMRAEIQQVINGPKQLLEMTKRAEQRVVKVVKDDAKVVGDGISNAWHKTEDITSHLYTDTKSGLSILEKDLTGVVKHGQEVYAVSLPFVVFAGIIAFKLF